MKKYHKILIILFSVLIILFTSNSMAVYAAKDRTASYDSDYRHWNQGDSAYSEMRGYGCFIVAQAKMLYEAGVKRSQMNPDFWYEWLWSNGCLGNPPSNINMVNAGGAASYASSFGFDATYWSGWSASNDQIWFNINAGYYTICKVNGGHYILVDNQTSKNTGQIYIYDSYNPSYAWWNENARCLLSRYTVNEIHVYSIVGSTVNPTISDNKNNVLVNENITFTYSGLTECSKANFYFEDWNGNVFLTKDSTSSRNYTHKFDQPGIFRVYSGGLYNGKWYYSSKITVYVFDPKLTCDKTNVDTNEEITFEYSGLSACDNVKICFEKNGTVYYEAENSSSRIHKNYFVNPGEYYVFAKGSKGSYIVTSNKIKILVGHIHIFDQAVAESKYLKSNADCTHPYVYYKSCECGEKGTETFEYGSPLGHSEPLVIIPAVSPTCTEKGSSKGYKCSRCNAIIKAPEEIPATGHAWGEWKEVKKATEKEEGLEERVCKNDASHKEIRAIPKKTVINPDPDKNKDNPKSEEPKTEPSTTDNLGEGIGSLSSDGKVLTDTDGNTFLVSEKLKNRDLKNKLQIADKSSGGKYKITKVIKKKGKVVGGNVTYMAPYNKNCTKATAGATVKLCGVKFNITAINANAFKNCKKLTTFKAGGNMLIIGKNAFNGCSSLKSVTITSTKLKSIGSGAFKGTTAKTKFKVPKSKLAKYSKMIYKAGATKKAKITK